MAESAIVTSITRHITRRGAWLVNVHGAGTTRRGIPDLVICYRGWFIAIEVKQPTGSPSRHQQRELQLVRRAGGIAIVARSVADVRHVLDDIDQQTTRTEAA